ncbi:MAG: AAA family ATPase [Candidatus Nanopusillus sp.]|jgi:predicted AAA+ superfamily ATPase|nr:AAA family ATPase [Candidatus Nanopusillus sp.]
MWWKKYGFSKNPLDIRPNEDLVGVDDIIKKVKDSIINGEIFLLYGPIGSGKTSLAFKIKRDLSDRYNVIYINGEYERDKDLEEIIEKNKYNKFLFFKFENKLPIVLILDEYYNFPEDVSKKLKYLYDNRIVHSIMLIQPSPQIMNATLSFLNRLYRKIEMKFPPEDEILKLINKKLKGRVNLDERILRNLIRKNNNNVRQIFIELSNLLEGGIDNINKDLEEIKNLENEIKLSNTQKMILEILYKNKMSSKDISRILNLPRNTVSKYLNKMYKQGILIREVDNNEYIYSINPQYINIISKKIGK